MSMFLTKRPLAGVAIALIGMSSLAIAQPLEVNYTIRLSSLKCWNEINEASASEEVYVLVTVADLRPPVPEVPIPPLPNTEVFHTGIFEDMDDDDPVLILNEPPFWD